jgi:hypothetical protein
MTKTIRQASEAHLTAGEDDPNVPLSAEAAAAAARWTLLNNIPHKDKHTHTQHMLVNRKEGKAGVMCSAQRYGCKP